jgi:hypothetical protein
LATFSIHLSNGVHPLLSFKWVAIIAVEGGSSKAERSQYTALVTPQTTAPRAINVTMIFMISSWKRASKQTRRAVALIMACDAEGVPTAAVFYRISQQDDMDTSTLLIIIVVLIVLSGGWYGRGRWY